MSLTGPQQSSWGPGRKVRSRWKADISLAAHRVDRLKAAKDKTLGVERNFTRNLQTPVLVHFRFGGLEGRLVGPHLPGENNLLAILRINGAAKVGIFAAGDIVLPGFDDLDASIFPEDCRPVLGPFAIGLHLFLRHGNHESCDVHSSGSLGCSATIAQASISSAPHAGGPRAFLIELDQIAVRIKNINRQSV